MTRPISVTVIAWVMIALSLEGLISLVGGFVTPIFTSGTFHMTYSLNTTIWMGAGYLVVQIILAALLLRGIGWARVVLVCLLSLGVLGTLAGRQPLALGITIIAKLVVFGYFLFRPENNEYFSASKGIQT
jgi:hypothetical protein